MTGPPEPYVPGPPSRPGDGPAEPGPPRIYVPGPDPAETELAGRLRGLAEELSGAGEPEGAFPERLAAAVLRDPELLDAVLRRMAAAMRKREGDAVAASGPAGWLLAAPLADRAEAPLLALRSDPEGSPTGDDAVGDAAGTAGASEGRRLFLVEVVASGAESLEATIRRLQGSGHEVVGGAVLARAGPEEVRLMLDRYNMLSLITLPSLVRGDT